MLCPRKVEDVFLSKEPSVGAIFKSKGQTVARAVVSYLITEALEFFSVKETMSDTQIAFTADLILEEYPYFQVDDLKLCFRNAMKLKYGEVYNRIDGQVIMKWLKIYNQERCSVADIQSYNEHKKLLSEEKKATDGIFYADYRAELEHRAALGDAEAKNALEMSDSINERLKSLKSNVNDKSENKVCYKES